MNAQVDSEQEIFVLPTFMKSGLQTYVVQYNGQFYPSSAIVTFREEPVPKYVKPKVGKQVVVKRKF